VSVDQVICDANIVEPHTGEFGQKTIVLGVQPGLDDINELPLSFDIAWYEQKAVAVLLALLFLGVKGIRLGPTLPAFLSPNVAKVLVENFNIKVTGDVKEDVAAMMAGK